MSLLCLKGILDPVSTPLQVSQRSVSIPLGKKHDSAAVQSRKGGSATPAGWIPPIQRHHCPFDFLHCEHSQGIDVNTARGTAKNLRQEDCCECEAIQGFRMIPCPHKLKAGRGASVGQ